jgi:hypothetical protein
MDEVDRVAARVTLSGMLGLISGAALATYRGTPKVATSMRVAGSFFLAGTACFGTERIGNAVIHEISPKWAETNRFYASHAFGGIAGGAMVGGLYQKWPVPGMLFFTPLMLAVAAAELQYEEMRQQKLAERKASIVDQQVTQ